MVYVLDLFSLGENLSNFLKVCHLEKLGRGGEGEEKEK